MNIIVNGITNASFSEFESKLEGKMKGSNQYFVLREMNINYCQGCWDCWLKTPGICKLKDDYVSILKVIPAADVVTIITPVLVGYESHLIKKFSDRMIPIVQPYIEYHKGEQHHVQRYDKNPDYRLIILEDEHTTKEDIKTIKALYERKLLNFRAELLEVITIKKDEDYTNVINRL